MEKLSHSGDTNCRILGLKIEEKNCILKFWGICFGIFFIIFFEMFEI